MTVYVVTGWTNAADLVQVSKKLLLLNNVMHFSMNLMK